MSFPHETGRIHPNDWSLVVGNAGCVRLWQWNGTDYDGPYKLCEHRSSFHMQQTHVSTPASPSDGRLIPFTSDMSGYGNHLGALPGFTDLTRPVGPCCCG